MARHARVAQAIFILVALAMAVLGVFVLWSDDKSGALVPLLLVLVFAGNALTWETVARHVQQFDDERAREAES